MTEFQNCYIIQWGIENFSCCIQKAGQCLKSPEFQEESSQNQMWYLKLYPRGYDNEIFVSVELYSMLPVDRMIKCIVSIADGDGSSLFSKQNVITLNKTTCISRILDFIKRDDLFAQKELLLPDDTLTLKCTIIRSIKQHSTSDSVKVEMLSFTWPIVDFSTIGPEHSDIIYPLVLNFEKAPQIDLKFHLIENPAGESDIIIGLNKTSKYLERHPKVYRPSVPNMNRFEFNDCHIFISFVISMTDSNGTMINLLEGEHIFVGNAVNETHNSPPVVRRSKLMNANKQLLPEDILTLVFHLRFFDGSVLSKLNVTRLEYPLQLKPSTSAFHNTMGETLYYEKKFCDITLKVDEESLSAHKAVLHMHSPVFRAMLDSDMAEKNTGVIKIDDFDADTMNLLLRLLYTGKVDHSLSYEKVFMLYAAAHKYQVSSLKYIYCALISKITTENVSEVISNAFKYDDATLKKASKSFISKYMPKSLDMVMKGDIE